MPKTVTHKRTRVPETRRRGGPPETLAVDLDLLHRVLDVLDHMLRADLEGPRLNSQGKVIWGDDFFSGPSLADILDIETKLKRLLVEQEKQQAIAEALAAHGITPAGALAAEARR
jgi:hypothetical protein